MTALSHEEWVRENVEQLIDGQSAKLLSAATLTSNPGALAYHQDWKTQIFNSMGDPTSLFDLAVSAEPAIKACLQSCWTDRQFSRIRNAGQSFRSPTTQSQLLTRQPSAFWLKPVPKARQDDRPVGGNINPTCKYTVKSGSFKCLRAYFHSLLDEGKTCLCITSTSH